MMAPYIIENSKKWMLYSVALQLLPDLNINTKISCKAYNFQSNSVSCGAKANCQTAWINVGDTCVYWATKFRTGIHAASFEKVPPDIQILHNMWVNLILRFTQKRMCCSNMTRILQVCKRKQFIKSVQYQALTAAKTLSSTCRWCVFSCCNNDSLHPWEIFFLTLVTLSMTDMVLTVMDKRSWTNEMAQSVSKVSSQRDTCTKCIIQTERDNVRDCTLQGMMVGSTCPLPRNLAPFWMYLSQNPFHNCLSSHLEGWIAGASQGHAQPTYSHQRLK